MRPTLADTMRAAESRIEEVTVYASGARVRRVASLRAPLPPGVRISGLPLAVIDDTVRCEVDGAAVATAVRVGLDVPGGDARSEESTELRAARRRDALAEQEVERLERALARLAAAPIVADDPTDGEPAPWGPVVAARRSLVDLRAARERALRDQLSLARAELVEARRALEVAVEQDLAAGTARAARLHEVRKHVELDLVERPGATEIAIRIEYQVAAARWAPSYVARLDGEQARFELRAVVAQSSGEDWTGVALRLSTAEPDRFAELPELQPQKIGRRQPEPARRGFRPPPAGAEALYADFDRGFPRRSARPISAADLVEDSTYEGRVPSAPIESEPSVKLEALAHEVWDEESSRSKEMYAESSRYDEALGAPPRPRQVPSRGAPMPPPAPAAAPQGMMVKRRSVAFELGAALDDRAVAPASAAVPPTPRLDYGNLRMAAASSIDRGRLVPAPAAYDAELAGRVARGTQAIEMLVLPPGHDDDWLHTYDYAFAADGKVDVASDAAWHSLALTSRTGSASIRHVAVPREQADVFRVAAIANPFDGPLLPGPIDVYERGQFLVTSEVDYTPPGGTVDVGLGVDPAVKIARNVEFHEEAAGMLRGALRLIHAVSIEVENLSQRAVQLEVRERLPVTREGDDDVEVALGKVEPPWERWTPDADAPREARLRGGYRWQVAIPGAGKKLLRAGYEIKIAGKYELVGGNRREP